MSELTPYNPEQPKELAKEPTWDTFFEKVGLNEKSLNPADVASKVQEEINTVTQILGISSEESNTIARLLETYITWLEGRLLRHTLQEQVPITPELASILIRQWALETLQKEQNTPETAKAVYASFAQINEAINSINSTLPPTIIEGDVE